MTKEELKEVFQQLEEQGWQPKLCDTLVPFYDVDVMCGKPNGVGDVVKEYMALPHEMAPIGTEFTITAKGDSMIDANIFEGDIIKVVPDVPINDGETVVARIDDEWVVKSYCEDNDGNPWLVPQNDDYDAFPLVECQSVLLLGKVDRIIRRSPRATFKSCMKKIEQAKAKMPTPPEISQLQISKAIREIAPSIGVGRLWYAVYRAMADLNVVGEGDLDGFIEMIRTEVPNHKHLPKHVEMQRMAVQSFAKPVVLWRVGNAPVQGKRYNDYLKTAQKMAELLEN